MKKRGVSVSSAQVKRWLPPRPSDAHKGDFGRVLIVAGSRGMTGAAVLAAKACLRSGAGLTTLAVPRSQQPIVASQLLEAQTLPLSETPDGSLAPKAASELQATHRERGYSVLAIGPGLTTRVGVGRAVAAILAALPLPAVIDADALNILSRLPRGSVRQLLKKRGAPSVFTPHPGEASRLGVRGSETPASRIAAAGRLAREFGVTVLLKGRGTVVTDGSRVFVNPTGNPGLAKGGSGDALTGIIAALWSQRLHIPPEDPRQRGFEAAALGAYLHGLSADIAAREKSVYSLLASDLIDALPQAFRKLQ